MTQPLSETADGPVQDASMPPEASQSYSGRPPYDSAFFDDMEQWAAQAAQVIVPIVLKLTAAKSVVDVGCGTGVWLAAFEQNGVNDYLGIDGEYVDRSRLRIPAERFRPADLCTTFTVERRFDLAVSLEVAEHLPAESADGFVASISALAPIVLFSAAIPFQGGTHHVNEQWPQYWVERFERHGFQVLDPIRPRIWENDDLAHPYRQNTLLFVHDDLLPHRTQLQSEAEHTDRRRLAMVHPQNYLYKAQDALKAHRLTSLQHQLQHYAANEHLDLSTLLRLAPRLTARAASNRWRRWFGGLRQE